MLNKKIAQVITGKFKSMLIFKLWLEIETFVNNFHIYAQENLIGEVIFQNCGGYRNSEWHDQNKETNNLLD